MKAVFVESPPFFRLRQDYLNDEEFAYSKPSSCTTPQQATSFEGQAVYGKPGTGIPAEARVSAAGYGSSTTGGRGAHGFWLFTLYGKNEASDLTAKERHTLKDLLDSELLARGPS